MTRMRRGRKATLRSLELFRSSPVKVGVLQIPGAKDPDEYIKKYRPERFQALLDSVGSALDFRLENLRRKYDLKEDSQRLQYVKEAVEMLASVLTLPSGRSMPGGWPSRPIFLNLLFWRSWRRPANRSGAGKGGSKTGPSFIRARWTPSRSHTAPAAARLWEWPAHSSGCWQQSCGSQGICRRYRRGCSQSSF